MEDLKISDEEPVRPVYGGGPLAWAMAARQTGRRIGTKTITGVNRTIDELAENKLKSIEEELQTVGENMKQLEKSAEKAVEREEKLKDKILQIQHKYKAAEGRYEYNKLIAT